MLNKNEIIATASKKTGFTQKDVKTALDAVLDSIVEANKSGEDVNLTGFGKFVVTDKPARTGRNPQTGEPINIAARKAIKFSVSSTYKTSVNA